MKQLILSVSLLSVLTCSTVSANSYDNSVKKQDTRQTTSESSIALYSEEQLAQMLAPIALYPDSLLTHILIASTYPLEVIEAERWISKNKKSSTSQIAKKLDDKTWEPSVKALVMFPDILDRLSNDLAWTQQLGDAFLQNEESVLQTIQNLRFQAKKAGNLNKMENVVITQEDNNIVIQPAKKEVVYVPYYDSRYVYGHWHYGLFPPVFWDWGHRVKYSTHNPFGWNAGIRISWNYFFSGFHWTNRHVVVINHKNTRHYSPKKQIVRSNYSKRWVHKPQHRKNVKYKSKQVSNRYSNQHKKAVVRHNKVYKANKHEVTKNKLKGAKVASQHKFKNKAQKQSVKKEVKQKSTTHKAKVNKPSKQNYTVKRERTAQKTTNRAQRSSANRTSHKGNNQGQRQARRERN